MTTISGMFERTGAVTMTLPASLRDSRPTSSSSAASGAQFADMNEIYRRVRELNEALEEARGVLESVVGGRRVGSRAQLASSSGMGLDLSPSLSWAGSTEELNTIPTSFTPRGPGWTGGSSTEVTVGGVYNGVTDDSLKFQVTKSRTVGGSRDIRIKVYDQGGTQLLGNLDWAGGTPADTAMTLANGLTVALGEGSTVRNDTFWVDVSASEDSEVDPSLPFDGERNQDPILDTGQAVNDGSFFVNGTEVAVSASDSLDDVLQRITATVDDVTASYDAASEAVTLERDTVGALDIALTGDSSGFLAAAKLSGASVTMGSELGEAGEPMESVAALASTVAGTLLVNDQSIGLDPATDSLQDVVDRINAADAGVTASIDEDFDKVVLASTAAPGQITLEDQGTGLLANLRLQEGSWRGRRAAGMSQAAARRVVGVLERVDEAMEALYETSLLDGSASNVLTGIIGQLGAAVEATLEDFGDTLEDAGVAFDLDNDNPQRRLAITGYSLERGLRSRDGAALLEIMVGSTEGGEGLLGLLASSASSIEATLAQSVGSVGLYLSTYA